MQRTLFLRLMEDLFERKPNTLAGGEMLEELNWDSLKALEFLTLVDDKLGGYEVAPDQLMECRTVDHLLGLVGEKLS